MQDQKSKIKNQRQVQSLKVFKFFSLVLIFAFYILSLPTPAYADCTPTASGIDIGGCFGFGGYTSFGDVTGKLVPYIFQVAAALVVIYFLWGAFKYLKSAGNKEEVAGARGMITHAIIGFIILIFAFFIVELIPQFFNLPGLYIFK